MCIIVLCEKVLWQEFLAYYQLNWRNFGIWQIQRFYRFKDATTWVKLWWWPWLQEVMELQTWREAWWPWHQEVIMELQRQREAGLQLYIVNTLLLLLQPLLHPPSNPLLPLCMLPSEFSALLLLLSPSPHFDTCVALAWIIWLESWVHRRLIRTYVYSFQTAHLYVIWCSVTLSFAEIDPIDLYLIWSTTLLSVAETVSSDLNYAKLCPSAFNGPLVTQLMVCNWCFWNLFF